jgi:hypothetical protein
MWDEVIELLIALPIAAALLLLVPRRVSRAWAIWLLICLVAVSLQWIGQGVYAYYNPDRLSLSIKENQVEIQKDQAGEVASVVVNHPPAYSRLSRSPQPVRIAGSSLLLACAALLLLLRAEPGAASPKTAVTSAGRRIGISLQFFGLAVLVATMAIAVVHRSSEVNRVAAQ